MKFPEPTKYGYCQCGCGRKTRPYRHTNATYGHVKGEPAKFLSGHGFVKPLEQRFRERVEKRGPDECWEWTAGRTTAGYGRIYGSKHEPLSAHRLAWEYANGRPIPEGREVCHTCDNPPCCNPAHLFLGTAKANADDRDYKGRGNHGERSYSAKLTWEKVRDIRERVTAGEQQVRLARQYGVTPTTVNDIVKGRSWRDGFR